MNSKKLETLLSSVTEDQKHTDYDTDELAYECEIYQAVDYNVINEHIKCVDLITWICTDEGVGLQSYYFDDTLVCISFKPARKCDTTFYWVGNEEYGMVRTLFISALRIDDAHIINKIDLFDDNDFDYIMDKKKFAEA